MKKILLLLSLSVLFSANVFAGNYNNKLTFDTYVFMKMHENKSITNAKSKSQDYFLQSKNGIEYTKLYIKVDENYSKSQVENLGCKELVKTKSVALLSVPINQIEQLSAFDFVELIEIAKQPKPLLDKALSSSNVDMVHQGEGLDCSYFGEGVIVGVLDWGFDFTHPMFFDENWNPRIKRAWIPYFMEKPPANFENGFLVTTADELFDIMYSSSDSYHGTHVLGIAAGSKVVGQRNTYSGIASKSDIAVVELGYREKNYYYYNITAIEGLSYLFQYADSVGKPIVVNMSFGWTGYSCDGMNLSSIQMREVIEEHSPNGKIIVTSAGNAGSVNMHFENDFSNIKTVESGLPIDNNNTSPYFTAMGEIGEEFTATIKIVDSNFKTISDSIIISTSDAIGRYDTLFGINNQSLKFILYIYAGYSYLNEKPAMVVFLYDILSGSSNYKKNKEYMFIRLTGTSGNIHCWNQANGNNGGNFIVFTPNVNPDSKYTISTPGTEEEVITVGAYVTRDTIVSFIDDITPTNGVVDSIARFSSKGPLTDGRVKPDITAPGSQVYSAYNHFDNTFTNENKQKYIVDKVDNSYDNFHEFLSAQGTSMSAPMVTGIVALMLEVNPKLTQKEIKDIIRITAINDQYTGNAKENKSTIWGWGKIDAHAIMKHLTLGVEEEQDFIFNIFPNPITNGNTNIQVDNTTGMPYVINVFDETGKLVYLSSIESEKQIDLSKLPSGTYFIKLHNHKAKSIQKVVKM